MDTMIEVLRKALEGFERLPLDRAPLKDTPEPILSYLVGGIDLTKRAYQLAGLNKISCDFRESMKTLGIEANKIVCQHCHSVNYWFMSEPNCCCHCDAMLP